AAAVADRVSRRLLLAVGSVVAAAAAAGWIVFALDPSRELALAAAGLTACAALEFAVLALQRLVGRAREVDRRLDDADARFGGAEARCDEVVRGEAGARAAELERTLARARADSLSNLVAEERRIAEERREALSRREHAASAELSEALAGAERRIAQRLGELRD